MVTCSSESGTSVAILCEHNVSDTPHSRRMVTMDHYEYADLIDDQDKVQMLIDPTSTYANAAAKF